MEQFDARSAILGNLDVRNLKGLELEPQQNPLVRKSDGFVLYVNRADGAPVRRTRKQTNVDNDFDCEIDIVWDERPLKDLVPNSMDYVVAGHTIGHVPDLIGWLMDLHAALSDDGLICLAIPDRRFSSDRHRPESTAGEIVEAYMLRAQHPPARHVFDQMSLQPESGRAHGWEYDPLVGAPLLQHQLPEAHELSKRIVSSGDYVDARCWVFTPESFVNVADRLSRIGLFPFVIEHLQPTEYAHDEFYVRLRKSQARGAIAASLDSAREILKNSLTEHAYREMLLEKVCKRKLPESAYLPSLRDLEKKKKRMVDELRICENDIRYYQRLLEEVQCSTSWRVTGPVRWLGRVLQSAWLTRKFLYAPFRRIR